MRFRLSLLLFLLAPAALANSYVFVPLEKAPDAAAVAAFANAPVESDPEDKLPPKSLRKEDLLRFLREGRIDLEPEHWPYGVMKETESCRGVVFTKDGQGYLWELRSPSALYLASPEHKSCLLVLRGRPVRLPKKKTYQETHAALEAPTATELAGFCNGEGGGTGSQMNLERDDIVRFLTVGKADVPREQWDALRQKGRVTIREPLKDFLAKDPEMTKDGKLPLSDGPLTVHGMFSTKAGIVYYWELWDDRLLHLQTPDGRETLLRTP